MCTVTSQDLCLYYPQMLPGHRTPTTNLPLWGLALTVTNDWLCSLLPKNLIYYPGHERLGHQLNCIHHGKHSATVIYINLSVLLKINSVAFRGPDRVLLNQLNPFSLSGNINNNKIILWGVIVIHIHSLNISGENPTTTQLEKNHT